MLADEARQTPLPANDEDRDGAGPDVPSVLRSEEAVAGDSVGHSLDAVAAGIAIRSSDAYGRLYELMADRLFALAYRLLNDRQEAEDAVQQAFLELARAESPPAKGSSLQAWLFASVRYTCIDTQRGRTRRPTVPLERLPEVDGEDDYDLGFDPHLEYALALLTPEQRLAVHLKHVEGLNGNQIAEIMGSSRMAIYAMASRAERRMRRYLGAVQAGRPRPPSGGKRHG